MQNETTLKRIMTFFRTPRGILAGLWGSYFLYWGSMAPFIPYLSLFYESIELTGSQIGQLSSIRALISFISAIVIAFLSDALRKRKRILIICILGMITALLLYPKMTSFVTLIPVVALYSIFQSPAISIIDEDTLRALDNPRNYSKVRVGGSFGWGIIVFASGLIMDLPDMPLSIMFTLHIFFLSLLLILILFLPNRVEKDAIDKQKPSFVDVVTLLRKPGFALWIGIVFLFGIAEASLINFLFLHIRGIGGSSVLMGLTMTFAIVGEIIGFGFARRLQVKVGSRRMIVLSLALRTFWFIFIALNRTPILILPIQILGGGSFALIESGSVAYVNERAPRRIGTTAQAIRSAALLRLSAIPGSLIAGVLYQSYGSANMYAIMAVTSFASFLLAAFLRTLEHHRKVRTDS